MARRGGQLREHIIWAAKDVFLETGFERASMDAVAARAQTSKRSLYAHFENKERLFLAVVEFVRGLFLANLRTPDDYAVEPTEALTRFCGRYLEVLLYEKSIQMCRVSIAEVVRFPEGAAQHFEVLFTQVHARLCAYLEATLGLSKGGSEAAAHRLLGRILYPRLTRALFGVDAVPADFDHEKLSPNFDLRPVREAVAEVLGALKRRGAD